MKKIKERFLMKKCPFTKNNCSKDCALAIVENEGLKDESLECSFLVIAFELGRTEAMLGQIFEFGFSSPIETRNVG